ncbi:MAG TPA: DNA recombination/repair protein RecA, partial [Chloroflexia bacterium]|nr:DNA recombination/repair protein RecA [Chloroflexia bacterium]
VVKNKVAPPFRVAEFDIMFNEGISRIGNIVDIGTELGILRKSGAFYSFGDQRLGQGRENVKEFLKGNLGMAEEIEGRIRTASASGALVLAAADSKGKKGAAAAAAAEDEDEEI